MKYDLTKVSHDVLDRPLAIADGSNMEDKFWTNRTYTFRELFTHTLSDFARGPKNGACILQGDLVGTSRQAKNVRACDLLMLDIDTGETIDAVADKVERTRLVRRPMEHPQSLEGRDGDRGDGVEQVHCRATSWRA